MSDPQSRGWGPGWPDCQVGALQTLVRRDGLRIPLRREIVPIVAYLMDETERRGYDIKPGQTWGFACRPIRGTESRPKPVPSYHSWGLSIDVNAPSNPMRFGKPGWAALHASGRTDMPSWLPPLWESMMFGWGGNYAKRQDAMHLEFMGTPADAARIVQQIKDGIAPVKVVAKLPLRYTKGGPHATGTLVEEVQDKLNGWIIQHRPGVPLLKTTGEYDGRTALYMADFKHWVRGIQALARQPVWPVDPKNEMNTGAVAFGALQFWGR